MRNLDSYDLIVCDIDDTIIYGLWTDLMHYTWNWFRSPKLSYVLMMLQDVFNLYKVNDKLKFMLDQSDTPLVFLTVRADNPHTFNLLNKILRPDRAFSLVALGSDYGFLEKPDYVYDALAEHPNILLIDDSDLIRENTEALGVDVLNPRLLREGFKS